MYNAIYIALKDLKKVVATNVDEIRRQAIVVLSDGEDTSSLLPFEEVLDLAKRSETAIYAIGLRSSEARRSSNKGFKEAEFVLRQLSQETGGRAFFPTQAGELPAIYGQISDELSSQYTVGYTSRNAEARRRLAPCRRARQPAERGAAHQTGVFRADALTHHEFRSAGSLRRSHSSPTSGTSPAAARVGPCRDDAAGRWRPGAHVRHRHADHAGRTSADDERGVGDLDVRLGAGCWHISIPR